RYEHDCSRRELAELIWIISHQNILEFLKDIPLRRQLRVQFEQLTADPQTVLGDVCDFLGLEMHDEMLQPYKDKSRRMTDGLHAESRMLGDLKFHRYSAIDPNAAHKWKEDQQRQEIAPITRELAVALGYEIQAIDRKPVVATRPELKPIERMARELGE